MISIGRKDEPDMALRTASWGGPWSWSGSNSSSEEGFWVWVHFKSWVFLENSYKFLVLKILQPKHLKLVVSDVVGKLKIDGTKFEMELQGKLGHGSVKKIGLNPVPHAIFLDLSDYIFCSELYSSWLCVYLVLLLAHCDNLRIFIFFAAFHFLYKNKKNAII